MSKAEKRIHSSTVRPTNIPKEKLVTGNQIKDGIIKEREKGKQTKKPGLGGRIALAGLALLGTTEAVGAIHHEMNNGLPASVSTVAEDVALPYHLIESKFEKPPTIPATFDSKADKTVIGVGVNMEPATSEDLAKITDNIAPSEDPAISRLPQISFLCPFLLKDGDWIKMTRTYRTSWGSSISGDRFSLGIDYVVPNKGTEIIPGIIDPKAVSIEVFKLPSDILNGKAYFGGVIIIVTRQDGFRYTENFKSDEDVRGLVPLPILDNAPTCGDTMKDVLSKKGLLITGKTPIMKTGISDAAISSGGLRVSPNWSDEDSCYSASNLFVSSNGKVLYLPAQP